MQVSGRVDLGHSLSMYTSPPADELTIDDFELFALDRLQLPRLELPKTRGFQDKEMRTRSGR